MHHGAGGLPCIGTVGARGLHRILAPAVQCVYKCCMPCLFSYLLLYLINRYLALNDAFLSKNCDLAEIVPILCKRPPQSATESLQSGAEDRGANARSLSRPDLEHGGFSTICAERERARARFLTLRPAVSSIADESLVR